MPVVKLAGAYAKALLLHTAAGVAVLLNCGVGLTTTDTVCPDGPLLQPFALEIITYGTVIADVVVLVSCSLIPEVPLPAASLIPVTDALLHANVAPDVALDKPYTNDDVLQIAGGVNEELS